MLKWSSRAMRGAAVQVVALDEPLGVLGVVEELDREAERVDDAHGLADAPGRARRHAARAGSRARRK